MKKLLNLILRSPQREQQRPLLLMVFLSFFITSFSMADTNWSGDTVITKANEGVQGSVTNVQGLIEEAKRLDTIKQDIDKEVGQINDQIASIEAKIGVLDRESLTETDAEKKRALEVQKMGLRAEKGLLTSKKTTLENDSRQLGEQIAALQKEIEKGTGQAQAFNQTQEAAQSGGGQGGGGGKKGGGGGEQKQEEQAKQEQGGGEQGGGEKDSGGGESRENPYEPQEAEFSAEFKSADIPVNNNVGSSFAPTIEDYASQVPSDFGSIAGDTQSALAKIAASGEKEANALRSQAGGFGLAVPEDAPNNGASSEEVITELRSFVPESIPVANETAQITPGDNLGLSGLGLNASLGGGGGVNPVLGGGNQALSGGFLQSSRALAQSEAYSGVRPIGTNSSSSSGGGGGGGESGSSSAPNPFQSPRSNFSQGGALGGSINLSPLIASQKASLLSDKMQKVMGAHRLLVGGSGPLKTERLRIEDVKKIASIPTPAAMKLPGEDLLRYLSSKQNLK